MGNRSIENTTETVRRVVLLKNYTDRFYIIWIALIQIVRRTTMLKKQSYCFKLQTHCGRHFGVEEIQIVACYRDA